MKNEHRIWRSDKSEFAGLLSKTPNDLNDETCVALAIYDDNELSTIAKSGFNAIWVHCIINNIVNVEPFPELGKNHMEHKSALRVLIERAARHGLKVFIYTQAARAVPVLNREFWDRHPDVGGQEDSYAACDGDSTQVAVRSLCTSTAPVRTWLKNAARQMAEELPGLGGIFMTTASERPSHCYGRRQMDDHPNPSWRIQCPRCRERRPEDIVVEIINLMRDGVREASDRIEVIAWNWSWTMWGISPPCHAIIDRLPEDVILMADFERGGRKDLWRRPGWFINEYSLAYAGPSELCLGVFDVARKRGMRVMSKLQLGTTHELASVVSLPLLDNVFKKAAYHRLSETAGFLGCWNFGNSLGTNTAAFNYFLSPACPNNEAEALENFAVSYFPGCDAGLLAESWRRFTAAMDYYPFSVPFLYNGIVNYTLAYTQMWVFGKLSGESAGPSHLIVPRGDELSFAFDYAAWGMEESTVFSLDEIIVRLGKLASAWAEALETLKSSLVKCSRLNARNEVGNAAICGAAWRSAFNTYKAYRLRRCWNDSLRSELTAIAADELEVLRAVLPHVENDPRQGYHAEAHGHMFDAASIKNKMLILQKMCGQGV